MLVEGVTEEVGHGMKAHLNVGRNDPIEGMEKRDDHRNKFFGKGSRDKPRKD